MLVYVGAGPRSSGMVEEINRWLAEQDPLSAEASALVWLVDPRLPKHWWGGTKGIPGTLYAGGYNHLDLDGFLRHVRGLAWRPGMAVQVFVKHDHDNGFRLIDLSPGAAGATPAGG